ncbi:hypothetical protein Ddye_003066 [Dipteronia dyeriana]|uniref:Alcohol dehydrogenase-like N-terminal domain-containing protein n=1 Tax=Dipteronia dyeriana TaxID=168575 RepID=A0AAD9XS28_9ROSI|nr:hypothetical protein Ddye_003066 [Dipteronia dyeriana]
MMDSESSNKDCLGWAARDPSGVLSPYNFTRRNGHGNSKYPLVPGHEIVGIVNEVGSNVQRFKVSDHVGVGTYVNSCRDCEYCNDGLEAYCVKGAVFTFNFIDADGTVTKGGYSSYIVVHERQLYQNFPQRAYLQRF